MIVSQRGRERERSMEKLCVKQILKHFLNIGLNMFALQYFLRSFED